MRCIFGLARPDRGEVRWNGAVVDREARLRFGYMPEQRGLYPRMRVARAALVLRPAARAEVQGRDAPRVTRWLERMGLGDRAKSKLEELSHGNQQRVQLAVALAHDPELLVLDEPFSGLDPIGIATMTEVVRERAAAGVGVIFSSHQLDLVEDVCEDVVIIAKGRIVAAGPIDELKARSGRRHLEVEVAGSDGAWLDGGGAAHRPGARRRPGQAARRRDGRPGGPARPGEGRRRGPSLRLPAAEAVRAVHGGVAAPTEEVARMSRLRSIWLVARREIIERGRSRGFLLSVLFTTALVVGSIIVPSILFDDDEPTQVGARRAGAGRPRRWR